MLKYIVDGQEYPLIIKIYSTPACGKCKMIKSKLKEKNIEFDEIDDIDILNSKGIRQVPVMELSTEILGIIATLTDLNAINNYVNGIIIE